MTSRQRRNSKRLPLKGFTRASRSRQMKSIGKTNADGSSRDTRRLALGERSLRRQTKSQPRPGRPCDYLADKAGIEVALRFLAVAHETFALLATQPKMGWHS